MSNAEPKTRKVRYVGPHLSVRLLGHGRITAKVDEKTGKRTAPTVEIDAGRAEQLVAGPHWEPVGWKPPKPPPTPDTDGDDADDTSKES